MPIQGVFYSEIKTLASIVNLFIDTDYFELNIINF